MKSFFQPCFLTIVALALLNVSTSAQSSVREDQLQQIQTKSSELQMLETQFLAPAEEDLTAYADFLRQPDTGLIRLLPREIYDRENDKNNQKRLSLRGGGAYYSFTRRTHEYGFGSDISLESNYLSVGFAGADYGILLKVGNLPLQEISLEHASTHFLSNYKAPTEESEARSEYRKFAPGTTVDGTLYQSKLPVELNSTYLLRSINYSRADVLVAFSVVRRDDDGSITIVWKLLRKYSRPVLARNNQIGKVR